MCCRLCTRNSSFAQGKLSVIVRRSLRRDAPRLFAARHRFAAFLDCKKLRLRSATKCIAHQSYVTLRNSAQDDRQKVGLVVIVYKRNIARLPRGHPECAFRNGSKTFGCTIDGKPTKPVGRPMQSTVGSRGARCSHDSASFTRRRRISHCVSNISLFASKISPIRSPFRIDFIGSLAPLFPRILYAQGDHRAIVVLFTACGLQADVVNDFGGGKLRHRGEILHKPLGIGIVL